MKKKINIFWILIGIGVLNTKGNVSMLHSYHTKKVKEEDKPKFGKLVGIGMIIIGFGIIASGACLLMNIYTENNLFLTLNIVLFIIGFVIGFGFILYAMNKYNGGLF